MPAVACAGSHPCPPDALAAVWQERVLVIKGGGSCPLLGGLRALLSQAGLLGGTWGGRFSGCDHEITWFCPLWGHGCGVRTHWTQTPGSTVYPSAHTWLARLWAQRSGSPVQQDRLVRKVLGQYALGTGGDKKPGSMEGHE